MKILQCADLSSGIYLHRLEKVFTSETNAYPNAYLFQGTVIDEEAESYRKRLFDVKVQGKLASSNIRSYNVHWMPQGVDPEKCDDHKQYLAEFCKNFVCDIKRLTEEALVKNDCLVRQSKFRSDHTETVHHLNFCLKKCIGFCGQEEVRMHISKLTGRSCVIAY